jgi:hypothetical protein
MLRLIIVDVITYIKDMLLHNVDADIVLWRWNIHLFRGLNRTPPQIHEDSGMITLKQLALGIAASYLGLARDFASMVAGNHQAPTVG